MTASNPVTPDGRYFVVRGRLWRCTNPGLSDAERETLIRELMDARRDIGLLKRKGADVSETRAEVIEPRSRSASAGRRDGMTARRTTIGTWRATLPTRTGVLAGESLDRKGTDQRNRASKPV